MKAVHVSLVLVLLAGCGDETPLAPTAPHAPATPDPRLLVVPGRATGPTTIAFVSADPGPGAVLAGCGPDAGGCRGRVRMVLRLAPSGTGPVLGVRAFLHATSKRACLLASTGPRALRAGGATSVEVVFDDSDACATPFEIATMAAVVEGTIEVASRQEWSVRYSFAP